MTTDIDVGKSVIGQGASRAAIDHEHPVWCIHRAACKAIGLGKVLVHVLGGGASVNCGYCLKTMLSSGEDAGNSWRFCRVPDSPHVGVI